VISTTLNRALLAAALALLIPPAVSAQAANLAPTADLAAVGRAVVESEVSRYGRVTNAGWDQDISSVLGKLQPATGYPGLHVSFVVVGNDDVNAQAVPGGSIVVNRGLLTFLGNLAGAGPGAHERFTGYLAAVLGHELAHITLGHTDSLSLRVLALAGGAGTPDTGAALRKAVDDNAVALEKLEHSRERELAADRAGSLYLLRAGWTIQTAMDLMRAVDSLERGDPSFYRSITYVRTHPRASAREAWLEAFRAQLKSLQADYDDALTLIRSEVALPDAVSLLDSVLSYFPGMLPALHARGTAYHELWLETVPVPNQRVRASLTTYALRFLPAIRGAPGDPSLASAARRDYDAVLAREPLSLTLSQRALLDAYDGECAAADQRSRQAVRADSSDADVANNRGVVLFVCNRPAEALQAFLHAQQLAGTDTVPALVFNAGRAMKAVGDPRATTYLGWYLQFDTTSEWAAEARRQGGSAPARPVAARASGRMTDAPQLQGIGLGASVDDIRARWGAPASTIGDTILVLQYPDRGVGLAVSRIRGTVLIGLVSREAGVIDGVRVGDPLSAARSAWGTPAEQSADDMLFDRGKWGILVRARQGQIGMLGIVAHD
jgi:predicted Zn-dependent protease